MSSLTAAFSPPTLTSRPAAGAHHIAILLATYNGAEMLPAQLDSIARQTHQDWSLLVSDDGSHDDTRKIVRAFAAQLPDKRIALIRGPRQGSAQNFLSLLRAAGRVPYVAFADQDDVWFDDKLARAISQLSPSAHPAIYGSATMITDQDLHPLRPSIAFKRPTSFQNALVQNVAGGNTMVVNRMALDALQPASQLAKRIVAHDWWCYQMVTGMGGMMIYDPVPSLLYRQHQENQIGANDTLKARLSRLKRLVRGEFSQWREAHFEALIAAEKWLSNDANLTLSCCAQLKSNRIGKRISSLQESGLYRQTVFGSAALRLATLIGRV
ncbi:MAG: glycosyltransferase family 2 protein [Boseongicola sp.]|nr:glycosyltransferase family 2 protein [Boseongicola sp.]